jgi:hypothetical protein
LSPGPARIICIQPTKSLGYDNDNLVLQKLKCQ